jgi:phage I-like protein
VLLSPWGTVESSNGSFVLDDESTRLAVAAFQEHGTDLPIDYEHQTLGGTYASPNGRAPAAGWIKALSVEPGVGLVATIEWTERATKLLASKEYRYLSPVAIIRKTDRRLVAIHSAALTNKPAIVGMEPIVNRTAIESAEESTQPLAVLRAGLDLPVETAPQEVLLAAGRRLVELEEAARRRYVEQRIDQAMRAGKLVEAQRAWAEALVARESDLFDEWFRTAPVIVSVGLTAPPIGVDGLRNREQVIASRARAEFKANPLLSRLTSDEAFISDAVSHARN